jgi:16S rRNA (guanine527-N7)-methyltransferase
MTEEIGLADPPAAAAEVFGEALPLAERYAALLAGPGVERGVVGPDEAARIWDRHLLNCAAIVRLIPTKCNLVDVGSGAGLPGIVLAMLLPSAQVTLVESLARRVAFLEECVETLGLANVEVVRARAEDLAGEMAADVVTARAVAPLDKLAGLCLGLLRPGGKVLAIKGASAESELTRARPVLARLGVTDATGTGGPGLAALGLRSGRVASGHRLPAAGGTGRIAGVAEGSPHAGS